MPDGHQGEHYGFDAGAFEIGSEAAENLCCPNGYFCDLAGGVVTSACPVGTLDEVFSAG